MCNTECPVYRVPEYRGASSHRKSASTETYRDRNHAQGYHKRDTLYYTGCLQMVQFQKLTRNLFLTLHGRNLHRQQRQLSKFLMPYQQFARSCLLRGYGASFQDGVAAGKGFLCPPF